MPAYPENVRSPGQTGSRRGPVKPTRMTHVGSRAFLMDFNCDAVIIQI
jgi:hypothetical protein